MVHGDNGPQETDLYFTPGTANSLCSTEHDICAGPSLGLSGLELCF